MRYDSKRSALLYFKKGWQVNKQINNRTFQIEEGSCLTTGALKIYEDLMGVGKKFGYFELNLPVLDYFNVTTIGLSWVKFGSDGLSCVG